MPLVCSISKTQAGDLERQNSLFKVNQGGSGYTRFQLQAGELVRLTLELLSWSLLPAGWQCEQPSSWPPGLLVSRPGLFTAPRHISPFAHLGDDPHIHSCPVDLQVHPPWPWFLPSCPPAALMAVLPRSSLTGSHSPGQAILMASASALPPPPE